MKRQNMYSRKLIKPSDLFLPAAFLSAALLGRELVALRLFIALYAVKLCALSTSNGLRLAFARQPSMRYVQGSALLALLVQIPGAVVAALALRLVPPYGALAPITFILAGLLLNIEHVFYEYLFAVGDGQSAAGCRGITAILTLAGLLLCAPPGRGAEAPANFEGNRLLITSGIAAATSLCVSLALGGGLKPKWNGDVLRCAPLSMLQTALYPALALAGLSLALPVELTAIPLFAGWTVYEVWRTPFRRAPMEAGPMNRALLILSTVAAFAGMLCGLILSGPAALPATACCAAVLLAALCAFALYGNVRRNRE